MKRMIFILILLSALKLSAQNYDLIVTTEGDSITCFIDSITNTLIFFEMKIRGNWIHTQIEKNSIVAYKQDVINKKKVNFGSPTSYINQENNKDDSIIENPYVHRYLFMPTAFALDKHKRYYSTFYFMIHDLHYGFSDKLSLCFGTSTYLFPYYIMPQFSFPINEKSAVAIGDLLLIYPWVDVYAGNLVYALYTRGTKSNNFSIGAGLWSTNKNYISETGHKAAFALSGQTKLSNNTYLVTENFAFQINVRATARKFTGDPNVEIDEHFTQLNEILFGMTGFRFISKKKPFRSWQIGILYAFLHENRETPIEYSSPDWDIVRFGDSENHFFAFPIISYSRKFGKR